MTLLCTFALAHADHDHLDKPALDLSGEARVRFDPINDQNAVRVPGVLIHVDRESFGRLTQGNGLHRRAHLDPDKLPCDAVFFEHLTLTGVRGSSVAAHRRKHKWPCPSRNQPLAGCAHDFADARDAATARGHGNFLVAEPTAVQTQRLERSYDLVRRIADADYLTGSFHQVELCEI